MYLKENRQINLTREDFLRPELNAEYSHLCNHSRPVISYLFGDDVSKSARELEDSAKITNRKFMVDHTEVDLCAGEPGVFHVTVLVWQSIWQP
ncbi:hypothetical protein DPMN_176701 [Dreissena polymorpha]|uniref:Uncharacterized protein n=1 Tax=Dreissena polymorpha TaxID=45954 RepID=A0A9D4E9Y3_DREPO|nr:hypothetical protein DPMN_176701 [Dreissena polymorpha]